MQCKGCQFGRENRGIVVSPKAIEFFCGRAARVKDEEAASILEPLLQRLAQSDECPHFAGWPDEQDSYVALDLPRTAQAR